MESGTAKMATASTIDFELPALHKHMGGVMVDPSNSFPVGGFMYLVDSH